MFNSVFVKDV